LAKEKVSRQMNDPLMKGYAEASDWTKKNSRPLLTGLLIAAALLAVFFIYRGVSSSRDNLAGEALAEALKIDQAVVADPLPPPQAGRLAFKTQDERHRKAFEAFDKVSREHASHYGDLARYYAATHQLYFEAPKAEATLKELADKNTSVGAQARLALAERYRTSGRNNEALAEYKNLKSKPGDVAPLLIDFNMAQIHQALDQKKEAADLYFNVAKESRSSLIGNRAVTQLSLLDPARVDQLPPEEKRGIGNMLPLQ
jgi:predicted negative regulator of RcsB-dependent stress response